MEQDIDIYEIKWVSFLISHSLAIIISIISIYGWYILNDVVSPDSGWYLHILFLPAVMCFPIMANLICLPTVPKIIIFKQSSIIIIGPLNHKKVFNYEDINRLVINHQSWLFPTQFTARIYFVDGKNNPRFDPERLPDLPAILKVIRSKGLGHVIEQN